MQPLVLSVNSYFVHGYIGNKCIVFSLELNGVEAAPINLFQYSNHRGYAMSVGTALTSQELNDTFEDLDLNEVTPKITHIITGNITEQYQFEAIRSFLERNPNVCYYCVPNLYEGNWFAYPNEVLTYQKALCKYADTVLLEHSEAEKIANMEIKRVCDVMDAVKELHNAGISNVVVKCAMEGKYTFFSFKKGEKQFACETKDCFTAVTGASDLFNGIFLANAINYPCEYEKIATNTLNSVHEVIQRMKSAGDEEIILPYSIDKILHPSETHQIIEIDDLLKNNNKNRI